MPANKSLYQTSQTLTHAACALRERPLQQRTEVQRDIALGSAQTVAPMSQCLRRLVLPAFASATTMLSLDLAQQPSCRLGYAKAQMYEGSRKTLSLGGCNA